jgi:ABC-type sugar transport system ATPase subunit
MRDAVLRNGLKSIPAAVDSIVEVRGISKTYGDVEALRGIDLDFPRGKLTSLLGPSGCGKTTLLKIIAGLINADGGTITVNGTRVSAPGPERAFVFQDFALMPWATVMRNVAFGLELRGIGKTERNARTRRATTSRRSASPVSRTNILMNFLAACVSGSAWHGRCRLMPTCCSSTNRFRPSMNRTGANSRKT